MPTFMDSLAANPSGGSSVWQPPGGQGQSNQDVLGLYDQIRNREHDDFQKKANFMADLSLKQERLRRMYDPTSVRTATEGQLHGQQPDNKIQTQQQPNQMMMGRDPNAMNDYQKGELGIRQKGLDLESQKLIQQNKMGEGALDIKDRQQKLNQEKSDQIHEQKMSDLQRKQDEYKQKMDLAQQQLTDKNANAEKQLELHKTIAENTKAYHDAEMAKGKLQLDQKDAQFKALQAEHDKLLKQNSRTKQVKKDSAGNQITTETTKGDAIGAPTKNQDGTYTVTGKDGQKYKIPAEKLDEWNQNHSPDTEQPQDQNDDAGAE
jgi:hypothetical protein